MKSFVAHYLLYLKVQETKNEYNKNRNSRQALLHRSRLSKNKQKIEN